MSTTVNRPTTKPAPKAVAPDAIGDANRELELAAVSTAKRQGELADAQRFEAEARAAAAGDKTRSRAFIDAQAETLLATDRLAAAEAEEAHAKAKRDKLIAAKRDEDHAAGIVRAQIWADRLHPVFARIDQLDRERADAADQLADVVIDAQASYDACTELESVIRPHVGLKERGLDRPSMATALYLARVHLAHVRSAGKRDKLPDSLFAEPEPAWDHPDRPLWDRACAVLGIRKDEAK